MQERLTVAVRDMEALAIGVAHVVTLASLLLAVLASVIDDDTHVFWMLSCLAGIEVAREESDVWMT